MNARLGFSIAAHLNPDVLIIDEVLSVGDMSFQEKCVQRMRSFKREGVTIVFVSHNLQAVSDLCDDALYMKGRVVELGPAVKVIDTYVRDAFAVTADGRQETELRIASTKLTFANGKPVEAPVAPGDQLQLRVNFEATAPISELAMAFRLLRSADQILVYDGQFTGKELGVTVDQPGPFSITFAFAANLTRGQYYFDILVGHPASQRQLARLTPAGHLAINENRTWGGIADLAVRAVAETHESHSTAV
jgi:hypothetical protein